MNFSTAAKIFLATIIILSGAGFVWGFLTTSGPHMVLREQGIPVTSAATIQLNGKQGVLIIPAFNGSKEIKQDIFDIKIDPLDHNGARNISMRIGSRDIAPTVFLGGLTSYGCASCIADHRAMPRWVELP